MGQRLVVTVNKNDKDLCKIYFHWSAYSHSALRETRDIINCIYNGEDETDSELLLRLIRFCEENGGGIRADDYEFNYIQSLYPNETFKKEDYSRNCGLIALSERGMEDLQAWSEGDVTINLDSERVENGVFGWYECLEHYNDERAEWDDEHELLTLDDIPDIGYDLGLFDIADIDYIIEELKKVDFICRYGNEIYDLYE